jgi:hypothetical protein
MLGGIVLAGYTLPGTTPLRLFLTASGACFVVGNILIVRKAKQIKAGAIPSEKGAWPHIFHALAIWMIFWLLNFLFLSKH